jgi:hypothetical protein
VELKVCVVCVSERVSPPLIYGRLGRFGDILRIHPPHHQPLLMTALLA